MLKEISGGHCRVMGQRKCFAAYTSYHLTVYVVGPIYFNIASKYIKKYNYNQCLIYIIKVSQAIRMSLKSLGAYIKL